IGAAACGHHTPAPDGAGTPTGFETLAVVSTAGTTQARIFAIAPIAGDFVAGGFFTDSSVTVGTVAVTGSASGPSATNPLLVRFASSGAIVFAKSYSAGAV